MLELATKVIVLMAVGFVGFAVGICGQGLEIATAAPTPASNGSARSPDWFHFGGAAGSSHVYRCRR
jgi:hypothetical protein